APSGAPRHQSVAGSRGTGTLGYVRPAPSSLVPASPLRAGVLYRLRGEDDARHQGRRGSREGHRGTGAGGPGGSGVGPVHDGNSSGGTGPPAGARPLTPLPVTDTVGASSQRVLGAR